MDGRMLLVRPQAADSSHERRIPDNIAIADRMTAW
jgi:hypothetical protein